MGSRSIDIYIIILNDFGNSTYFCEKNKKI